MSHTLHLEIITPQQTVFVGDIINFAAPGVMGRFEILRNHIHYISSITIGHIRVCRADGREDDYATSGGFVEVLKNRITYLAESCEKADAIDRTRAKEAIERAKIRLEDILQYDKTRCLRSIQRAKNRLTIAERAKG